MKRLFCAGLMAISATACPAAAADFPSFEMFGHHVGDSKELVGVDISSCYRVKTERIQKCSARFDDRTLTPKVVAFVKYYNFVDNKLFAIQTFAHVSTAGDLVPVLTAKYGPPTVSETRPVKYEDGSTLSGDHVEWKFKEGVLTFDTHTPQVSWLTIFFEANELANLANQLVEEATREQAKSAF